MISIIFVILGFSIVSSSGFLLDSSTNSPHAEIVMSDSHFTTLMKLFLEERESREKLQNFVQRLQQELTSKVDSLGNCNCKGADITDELKNNTERLQTELDFLRKDFNALQLQCAQFDKRLSTTENTTGHLHNDIDGLKQLKGVADLQVVFNLANKTNHLEVKVQTTEQSIQTILSSANARSQDIIGLLNKIKVTDNMTLHLENELQKSNGRLNTVVSDINSRKQDVLALVNKTEDTNHQLKSLEVLMKHETHNLENNITNKLNQSITSVKRDMINNAQHLQSGLNDTLAKMDRISNRAVLTAWAFGGTVAAAAVIPFKQVHTSHGIQDQTSITNEGKFTCEKPGLYLIAVYVSTRANNNGYYDVYKNNGGIARAFRHQQSYVITFTTIVTERLEINDTVYVMNNGQAMFVYGDYQSTLSIIQIG